MDFTSYLIHPTQLQGAARVPVRSVVLGAVQTDSAGQGHIDSYVPGQEERLRAAFEQPIEVRGADGQLLRTLQPYTREALDFLVRQGGLNRHGLAAETLPPQ